MATLTTGAGFGPMSGRLGNVVLANTADGVIMRGRPDRFDSSSPAQSQIERYMTLANQFWRKLTTPQFEAWQAYARSLGTRDPATAQVRAPKAVNVFTGLTIKYLQLHGGFTAPLDPPEGVFLGDVVKVAVTGSGASLLFTPNQANQPGVVTELLAQTVRSPHNMPRPRSYKSLGFVEFVEPLTPFEAQGWPDTWVCAYRFVESSSGRATGLIDAGRVTITEW